MIAHFDLVPVLDLVGLFVHVDPVELRGAGPDGRDEPFALPAPVVLGVGEEVAAERVSGGVFEFEFVFEGDVEILSDLDVELIIGWDMSVSLVLFFHSMLMNDSIKRGKAHLVILQHHHASINLRALRRVLDAGCNEIGLLSTVFLFGVFILP